MIEQVSRSAQFEELLDRARPRLVQLCAILTGNPVAAEDLAQETLLEAWRQRAKLTDLTGYYAWLSSIARNVCKRYVSANRKQVQVQLEAASGDFVEPALIDQLADPYHFELDLERHELAELLDRALALLPVETRTALLAHYIEKSPLKAIAAQTGLSENNLAVRLHRGKLNLQQILTTSLSKELTGYLEPNAQLHFGWQTTSVWCPLCGIRRLQGRFNSEYTEVILWCEACCPSPVVPFIQASNLDKRLGKTFKSVATRMYGWVNHYHLSSFKPGSLRCVKCGTGGSIQPGLPSGVLKTSWNRYSLYSQCLTCGTKTYTSLGEICLALPQGYQFRRDHSRIRLLPYYEVEAEGRPAVVARFESLTDGATFETVTTSDGFKVLKTNLT